MRGWWLITSTLALLPGCAGEPDWKGTVADSAGIAIVHNPEDGTWNADDTWRVREVLRIGTAAGDADYQFGAIVAVAVAANGDIYVVDQQASSVKQFDSAGSYVQTFGGAGSGPGQVGPNPSALAIVRDTIYLLDQGNSRVNRYLLNGSPAGSFRVDPAAGVLIRLEASPDETLIAQTRRFGFPGVQPDSMDHVVELSSDGTHLDTLFSFPSGATFSMAEGRPQFRFFSAEPIWNFRADGSMLFAINDTYRIEIRDSSGAPSRIVTKPYTPNEVTESDAEGLRNAFVRLMVRNFPQRPSAAQTEQMRQMVQFAERYPAFATMAAGPGNSIWVQHIRDPSDALAREPESADFATILFGARWDVFDENGHYLGVIDMPGSARVLTVRDDALYGVATDELGVEYVVKLVVEQQAVATAISPGGPEPREY